MTQSRRKRLEKRKERLEQQIDEYNDLLDAMANSDVQSYTIGSRTMMRYKSPQAIREVIKDLERALEEIEMQLEGGGRRKAVAVIPRNW